MRASFDVGSRGVSPRDVSSCEAGLFAKALAQPTTRGRQFTPHEARVAHADARECGRQVAALDRTDRSRWEETLLARSLLHVWVRACLLSLACLAVTSPVAADDLDDPDSYALVAVQDRHYFGTHELGVTAGLLPLDAFTKGVTVGGNYTLHFSPLFGWEVINYLYSIQYDSSLREDLDAFDLDVTPFEVVKHIATTNLVFKPVYWKGALLNDMVIHGELYGVVGAGMGWFTRSRRPAVDIGVGVRIYLSELFSMRLDVRHHWFFEDAILDFELEDELWIGLGFGLTL